MLFRYLKTAFSLIVGLITQDTLVMLGVAFWLVLLVWIVLSLLVCKELKLSRLIKKLNKIISKNGINASCDAEVYAIASKLPRSFYRDFRMLAFLNGRTPSMVLTQTNCIENYIYGGIYNQNRSVMRSVTTFVSIVLMLLSVGLTVGATEVTGLLLAEAVLVPLVFWLLYVIEFYVYTTIRHYLYRLAVDNFNDLLDTLNEQSELNNLHFDNNDSNIFKISEDDMDNEETKRGRGRPKKTEEEKNKEFEINNDTDFSKALDRAEKLMGRLHKPLSDSQKRRTNKELAELMELMANYKKGKK